MRALAGSPARPSSRCSSSSIRSAEIRRERVAAFQVVAVRTHSK
jgi:hypothetical protein